jgi:hypothetical protein
VHSWLKFLVCSSAPCIPADNSVSAGDSDEFPLGGNGFTMKRRKTENLVNSFWD